jgi:hypothetical protein
MTANWRAPLQSQDGSIAFVRLARAYWGTRLGTSGEGRPILVTSRAVTSS